MPCVLGRVKNIGKGRSANLAKTRCTRRIDSISLTEVLVVSVQDAARQASSRNHFVVVVEPAYIETSHGIVKL